MDGSNYGSSDLGRKDDVGKLRFDLIPVYPLEETARVYTIGAAKYADRNWEKGLSWSRVFSAMMRHAWAWWRGEIYDPVDGQHHLASVAWCAFALMDYQRRGTGTDDRAPAYINHAVSHKDENGLVYRMAESPSRCVPRMPSSPVGVAWGQQDPGDLTQQWGKNEAEPK